MSLFGHLKDKFQSLKPSNQPNDVFSHKLNTTIFSCSHDSLIKSWSVASASLDATFKGSEHAVYTVHLSPYQPSLLFSGGYDCAVRVWDIKSVTCVSVLREHSDSVFSLLLLPDGRLVSGAGSKDNTIKIWDLRNKKVEATLTGHLGGILALVYLPYYHCIASASIDHTIKIWKISDYHCEMTLHGISGHTLPVSSLLLADDHRLVSASHDNTIKVWDLRRQFNARKRPPCDISIKGHDELIQALCLLPAGKLASCSRDMTIKIWSLDTLATAQPLLVLQGHTGHINSLSMLPDQRLISSSSDCTIRVWNIEPGGTGGRCEMIFNNTGNDGRLTVVYGVCCYRAIPSADASPASASVSVAATIKPSTSRDQLPPPPHAAAVAAVANASISNIHEGSDSQVRSRTNSKVRDRPPSVVASPKTDAGTAAALEQSRQEKLNRAKESERLRQLEQAKMLEDELVDEEEYKRFSAYLALKPDSELNEGAAGTVNKYRNAHHLNYHDILSDGWYDDGGLIPGVNSAKVGKERGGGRWEGDVIVFDSTTDAALADVIEMARKLVRQQDTVKARVQILAQLVSNKLGGLPNDVVAAWERVMKKAVRYRKQRILQLSATNANVQADNRVVLSVGALTGETGLTRHRACLFKYLCDLTTQNPEEWCYPTDDAPLSPRTGDEAHTPRPRDSSLRRSPLPRVGKEKSSQDMNANGNHVDAPHAAMPLSRFLGDDLPHVNSALDNSGYDVDKTGELVVADGAALARPLRAQHSHSQTSDGDEETEAEEKDRDSESSSIPVRARQLSPDELAIHCRLIRGQYQYYVPRSRKHHRDAATPSGSVVSPTGATPALSPSDDVDERGRERVGGYHAWNVVIINGEHYVVDLIYQPSMLYHEASREAMHYNRGRRGAPKQTGLTNLPVRDVREIDWSELTNITNMKDGGFGRLEKAKWRGLDVVVKTPLTADLYVIKTFIEEARVLNTLSHPNIVQLIGVCSEKKAIVLEYINGGDVHQWLQRHANAPPRSARLPPGTITAITLKQRLDVLIQSALAMQYLHGCEPPIVHRDLKTLNLLIQNIPGGRVIKVCDFGLARSQKHADGLSTQHRDMGTPSFQSPEQWNVDQGEPRLTEKTDCYSFGGIMIEVLTDHIPWIGEKNSWAVGHCVVEERKSPPIDPIPSHIHLPTMLVDLIKWCHRYEPERRPSFPDILRVLRDVDDSLPSSA